MDALGLALAMSSASGMHILNAGDGIDPPSGASTAIVCVIPDGKSGSTATSLIGEQVYIVTKGNSCAVSFSSGAMIEKKTCSWGDQDSNINVIYLG